MNLPDECNALEAALRDAGGHLGNTLARVPMNRTTWTRWKNGAMGCGLKRWSRVQEVFATDIQNATLQRAAENAAQAALDRVAAD